MAKRLDTCSLDEGHARIRLLPRNASAAEISDHISSEFQKTYFQPTKYIKEVFPVLEERPSIGGK